MPERRVVLWDEPIDWPGLLESHEAEIDDAIREDDNMPSLDPALAAELAHQARRRQPLPPLDDIPIADDALAIVRAEEARREAEAMTNAYDAEWGL